MSCPSLPHFGSLVRTVARPAAWSVRSGHTVSGRTVSSRTVRVWAIVSAGLSPIVLLGAWLVAGARQPASYSPVRQTVSVLAGHAATDRWIVTGALFVAGGCHVVTAAGLSGVRASGRILLVVAGASGIGIAASPEPVHGSTPQHLAWTALGAATIAVWPAFVAQRISPRPRILSVYGSATVTAGFLGLLGWLVYETQGGDALGLAERLYLSAETAWPFIVAVALRRTDITATRQELPAANLPAANLPARDPQATPPGARSARRMSA
jgi:hypothetical protein